MLLASWKALIAVVVALSVRAIEYNRRYSKWNSVWQTFCKRYKIAATGLKL